MFGLFIIEAGSEPVAVTDREGKPCVYSDGSNAAAAARQFADGNMHENMYVALKCQPRRLANDAWKTRELGRFADGTYVALPWADLPSLALTADHFSHISTEDGAKIAYTKDAAKGAGDIQTRVKPGKYLAQFYGGVFDAPTIARMSAEFSRDYGENNVLLFAETASEIERVYVDGPSSCMSHAAAHYASPVHPVTVYAAGDLAVAYMERGGEITARALCWPAKGLHGRVYGDETRLADLLESAAFSYDALDGAKMLRIEHGDGFVVPYIDGAASCQDDGEHLILGGCGVRGDSQNGLSGSSMGCCSCLSNINEDDSFTNDSGDTFCDECYSERYSYCERYSEECLSDGMREVICSSHYDSRSVTTQYWGESAIGDHAFTCDGNGKLYSNDFLVTLADGTTWSKEYFDDNGVTIGGKLYDKADAPEEPVTPSYAYRWQHASTFSCEAQTTLDFFGGLSVEERGDMFHVMRYGHRISSWHGVRDAQEDLEYRQLVIASQQVAA